MPTLEGKIAIVTGGGQGVGREARALSAEGAVVAITGRTPEKLDATVTGSTSAGGRALAVPGNVKDEADIARTVDTVVEQFGTIDILVNNAQEVTLGPLLDMQRSDFESGWLSGPLAAFSFMKACHPHLCGGGVIVNLVTSAALRPDGNNYGVYSAVKEAMRSLTRTAACEWGPQGVRGRQPPAPCVIVGVRRLVGGAARRGGRLRRHRATATRRRQRGRHRANTRSSSAAPT